MDILSHDQFIKKPSLAAWDLIPEETILVYETSNCSICIDQVRSSPVLEIITRAMEAGKQADSLTMLETLWWPTRSPAHCSLHITTKNDFDFTFYLPQTKQLEQQLTLVVDGLKKSAKAVQSEHGIQRCGYKRADRWQ